MTGMTGTADSVAEERPTDNQENEEQDVNVEGDELEFGLKKKKKKASASGTIVSNGVEDDRGRPEGDTEAGLDDFSGLKKKKRKKTTFAEPDAAEAGSSDLRDGLGAESELFDMKDLKKKKKKKKQDMASFEAELKADGLADGDVLTEDEGEEAVWKDLPDEERQWQETDRGYTYDELLRRAFRLLRSNNPELVGEKRRYVVAPPQVLREGSKKSVFANIVDICRKLHRQPEHLKSFLFAELGTSGSVDGTQRLVIKGKYQQKQIENVLRRYIVEYVTCKTCKNRDTILVRENRLYFMQCNACGSSRSVAPIQKGFKAQTESRRAQRSKIS